jgi:hypothetical protein
MSTRTNSPSSDIGSPHVDDGHGLDGSRVKTRRRASRSTLIVMVKGSVCCLPLDTRELVKFMRRQCVFLYAWLERTSLEVLPVLVQVRTSKNEKKQRVEVR